MHRGGLTFWFVCLPLLALADGPGDNLADKVRPVPPPGTVLPAADRAEIHTGVVELQALIKDLGTHKLLPDVQVYEKAARWALDYDEVYDGKGAKPGANVKAVLKTGIERAKALKAGKAPWTTATGPVVRGYRSKIDGSVQPYGIVVPQNYDFAGAAKHRLDFWWHGRGENLSEANFIADRERNPGQFVPAGALVVHPFGRYCNANKFAGEIDTLEILDHVRAHYRVDDKRLVARGFSMGGAACWQYAAHYPCLWCAAAPGAGFAETKDFLRVFQKENVNPPWYEQKLWRMYDATAYAENFATLPTVAYSGEKDSQKQAADIMEVALKKAGLELTHIIGIGAGHHYTPVATKLINEKIDAIVAKGNVVGSKPFDFVTYSLRYPECGFVRLEGLQKHWGKAHVRAALSDKHGYLLRTVNVTALSLPIGPGRPHSVTINETHLALPEATAATRVLLTSNAKGDFTVASAKPAGLAKTPGLQGPIDDAFLDAFLMVRPTGTPMHESLGRWTTAEMQRATEHWRKQFRGDAPIKDDKDITAADIARNNLILWGDPKSNAVLAKIADKLPLKEFSDKTTTILIYPNPLNPKKYVVLNSGFTFRDYDYLNNARQVSKLADYAVIDLTTPPNSRYPGKVIRGGFFDERWQVQKNDGQDTE